MGVVMRLKLYRAILKRIQKLEKAKK